MSAKKVQVLNETPVQKKLHGLLIGVSIAFAAYRVVITVIQFLFISWETLDVITNAFTGVAAACAAAYALYMLFGHPQKKLAAADMRARFGVYGVLAVGMLVWSFFGFLSVSGTYTDIPWWDLNKEAYIDLIAQILILMPLGGWIAEHRDSKAWRIPTAVILFAAAAASVYIISVVLQPNVITLSNGACIGMDGNLSLLINCNRNITGIMAYTIMMLSVCMAFSSGKWLKLPYGIASAVFFVIISLSQSRTSILAMCITLGLAAGLYFACHVKPIGGKKAVTYALSAVTAVAAALVLMYLRTLIFDAYLNISDILSYPEIGSAGMRELNVTDSNGRFNIWMASLKAMVFDARSFVFGITPTGVGILLKDILELDHSTYTHNQFLEIAVAYGVPALAAFIAMLVINVKCAVKVCLHPEGNAFREMLVPLFIFLLLLANMMEARLFANNYVCGIIFAILLGWLPARARLISESGARK